MYSLATWHAIYQSSFKVYNAEVAVTLESQDI